MLPWYVSAVLLCPLLMSLSIVERKTPNKIVVINKLEYFKRQILLKADQCLLMNLSQDQISFAGELFIHSLWICS